MVIFCDYLFEQGICDRIFFFKNIFHKVAKIRYQNNRFLEAVFFISIIASVAITQKRFSI
jgi:hypothetical protein